MTSSVKITLENGRTIEVSGDNDANTTENLLNYAINSLSRFKTT